MKIGNQEYLKLKGNEFYQIIYFVSKQKIDSKWLAKVRVIRLDTMEFIAGGFAVFEPDKKSMMNKIKNRVNKSLFPELEKAGKPSDWNSELRKILLACLALRRKISNFGKYANDRLAKRVVYIPIDEFIEKYRS